jgi:hypothetical protein
VKETGTTGVAIMVGFFREGELRESKQAYTVWSIGVIWFSARTQIEYRLVKVY